MSNIVYKKIISKKDIIVIRYPKRNDLRAMLDYANELSKEKTFVTFQGETITRKQEQKYLRSVLKNNKIGNAVTLLLFHNNDLAGIAEVVRRQRVKRHIAGLGISIKKTIRGRGMGKLLIRILLREAKKNISRISIITLEVFLENKRAIALYKKHGFKKYGLLPNGLFRKGRFDHEVLMYKSLR